ncbi:MAG: hypothetical protein ACRC1P_05565 [Cellulosilyticaceae bacterium]
MGLFGDVVGSVVGGLVGGASNAMGQAQANAANSAEAQKNRDWTERMSNTAYQRQVADMRAAGINPMLAMGGSGASTPTGSTATHQNTMGEMSKSISSSAQKLVDYKMAKKQLELADIQANQMKTDQLKSLAEIKAIETNTELSSSRNIGQIEQNKSEVIRQGLLANQAREVNARIDSTRVQTELNRATTAKARLQIIEQELKNAGVKQDNINKVLQSKNIQVQIRTGEIRAEQIATEVKAISDRGQFGQHTDWILDKAGQLMGTFKKLN